MALFKYLMPRPTALCLMPEFSNRLGGGLIQWHGGFDLALVPVRLWCDEASALRPAALVYLETRVQTSVWGYSLTSHRSCGTVAVAGLERWVRPGKGSDANLSAFCIVLNI